MAFWCSGRRPPWVLRLEHALPCTFAGAIHLLRVPEHLGTGTRARRADSSPLLVTMRRGAQPADRRRQRCHYRPQNRPGPEAAARVARGCDRGPAVETAHLAPHRRLPGDPRSHAGAQAGQLPGSRHLPEQRVEAV